MQPAPVVADAPGTGLGNNGLTRAERLERQRQAARGITADGGANFRATVSDTGVRTTISVLCEAVRGGDVEHVMDMIHERGTSWLELCRLPVDVSIFTVSGFDRLMHTAVGCGNNDAADVLWSKAKEEGDLVTLYDFRGRPEWLFRTAAESGHPYMLNTFGRTISWCNGKGLNFDVHTSDHVLQEVMGCDEDEDGKEKGV